MLASFEEASLLQLPLDNHSTPRLADKLAQGWAGPFQSGEHTDQIEGALGGFDCRFLRLIRLWLFASACWKILPPWAACCELLSRLPATQRLPTACADVTFRNVQKAMEGQAEATVIRTYQNSRPTPSSEGS